MRVVRFHNDAFDISLVTIGAVVEHVRMCGSDPVGDAAYGHLMGFALNSVGELIMEVKFAGRFEAGSSVARPDIRYLHPTNLNLLVQ
jgi:hypothetical protein